jgi:hypothetical protein
MISKHIGMIVILSFAVVNSQPCNQRQTLSATQSVSVGALFSSLDVALQAEQTGKIDSLSLILKKEYADQGGIPDVGENYRQLTTETALLTISDAISVSRRVIDKDSALYRTIWQLSKGREPPAYPPHSIFLRQGAVICSGLLKIAAHESDNVRKQAYTQWAIQGLDSLLTMQLASGAFPFPDLRTYNDTVFSTKIQRFLNTLGPDSSKALLNGWIVSDFGSGEFDFDCGVICGAFADAFVVTKLERYKQATLRVAEYLRTQRIVVNYNYNSFVAYGLARAFSLTGNPEYRDRAAKVLRIGVLPGQLENGRWVDGHNARSAYHAIIIFNAANVVNIMPAGTPLRDTLAGMLTRAARNFSNQLYACGPSGGYVWLIEMNATNVLLPSSLKDSLSVLLGRHCSQSIDSGLYLDVSTIGSYIEHIAAVKIRNARDVKQLIRPESPQRPVGTYTTLNGKLPANFTGQAYSANGKRIPSSASQKKQAGSGIYLLR